MVPKTIDCVLPTKVMIFSKASVFSKYFQKHWFVCSQWISGCRRRFVVKSILSINLSIYLQLCYWSICHVSPTLSSSSLPIIYLFIYIYHLIYLSPTYSFFLSICMFVFHFYSKTFGDMLQCVLLRDSHAVCGDSVNLRQSYWGLETRIMKILWKI